MTAGTQHTAGAARSALPPAWRLGRPSPAATVIVALGVTGFGLFLASLHGIALNQMNGLGLLSVLPASALAGITLLALALAAGICLPRPHPAVLGAALGALVICLDGVTAFVEPEPRFPTAYQISGFVQYLSSTGHASPGLAAYFSWPGFFALVSMVTGAAGVHSLLGLMRIWPMVINLLCLPPFFLMMRNLRIPWRAKWAAGLLFALGNWVGQDYFSPQSFNYVLYLVFLAILVNWFTEPGLSAPPRITVTGLARVHRRLFGIVRPGELGPRPASTGQRAFLLAVLIGIFVVATMSHQLTPFYLLGAVTALVVIRRTALRGLPVLLGTIVVGWVSFAAVDYWSGHMANIFGGIGSLGSNLTSSVGGRLTGSTSTHLIPLHMREAVAATIVGLAVAGLLRRRRKGFDDRVLLALFLMPMLSIALQSYGGEMALRIYLFMLPAASVLAGCFFFGDPRPGPVNWRVVPVLGLCAALLPAAFLLARYGNEAFEQTPPGELAASNWIYAHDAHGARVLWLSDAPALDNTPEMPWSYRDMNKVVYTAVQAPRDPSSVSGVLSALRSSGPGSYLITTGTQDAYLEQAAGYRPGWGSQFNRLVSAAPGVRVEFASSSAVVYTLRWPPGARPQPLPPAAGPGTPATILSVAGLILLFALIGVLAVREFTLVCRPPGSRLIRPLTAASVPLLVLVLGDVILRFAGVT